MIDYIISGTHIHTHTHYHRFSYAIAGISQESGVPQRSRWTLAGVGQATAVMAGSVVITPVITTTQ